MHRRQIRPRKIDEFKRMPILRDEVTANDGVDRFFQYDDDAGAPQRVSRSELEVRAPARARGTRTSRARARSHTRALSLSRSRAPSYARAAQAAGVGVIPKQKKLNIPVCPCHDVADYKPALPPLASVSYIRIMKDGLPADDSTSLAIEFTLTKADEAFADALAKKLGAADASKVAPSLF